MLKYFLFVGAFLILADVAEANAPDTPFFDAFKRLCVDTKLDTTATIAAVKAAGGKVRAIKPVPGNNSMTETDRMWDVSIEGRPVVLLLSSSVDAADGTSPKTLHEACSVSMENADTSSLDAARKWIGVAPSMHSEIIDLFEYWEDKGVHKPLPQNDAEALHTLLAKTPVYSVSLPSKMAQRPIISIERSRPMPKG